MGGRGGTSGAWRGGKSNTVSKHVQSLFSTTYSQLKHITRATGGTLPKGMKVTFGKNVPAGQKPLTSVRDYRNMTNLINKEIKRNLEDRESGKIGNYVYQYRANVLTAIKKDYAAEKKAFKLSKASNKHKRASQSYTKK